MTAARHPDPPAPARSTAHPRPSARRLPPFGGTLRPAPQAHRPPLRPDASVDAMAGGLRAEAAPIPAAAPGAAPRRRPSPLAPAERPPSAEVPTPGSRDASAAAAQPPVPGSADGRATDGPGWDPGYGEFDRVAEAQGSRASVLPDSAAAPVPQRRRMTAARAGTIASEGELAPCAACPRCAAPSGEACPVARPIVPGPGPIGARGPAPHPPLPEVALRPATERAPAETRSERFAGPSGGRSSVLAGCSAASELSPPRHPTVAERPGPVPNMGGRPSPRSPNPICFVHTNWDLASPRRPVPAADAPVAPGDAPRPPGSYAADGCPMDRPTSDPGYEAFDRAAEARGGPASVLPGSTTQLPPQPGPMTAGRARPVLLVNELSPRSTFPPRSAPSAEGPVLTLRIVPASDAPAPPGDAPRPLGPYAADRPGSDRAPAETPSGSLDRSVGSSGARSSIVAGRSDTCELAPSLRPITAQRARAAPAAAGPAPSAARPPRTARSAEASPTVGTLVPAPGSLASPGPVAHRPPPYGADRSEGDRPPLEKGRRGRDRHAKSGPSGAPTASHGGVLPRARRPAARRALRATALGAARRAAVLAGARP